MALSRNMGSAFLFGTILMFSMSIAFASTIDFSGELDVVSDAGGAIYSAVPIGTTFSGSIDDVTGDVEISDGTTTTMFTCCITPGILTVTNNMVLSADDAALFNMLLGSSMFNPGDEVDGIDLEGDGAIATGGRIEVGLSYVFASDTFSDTGLDNYPFDPADVLLSLFFIIEDDSFGDEIYSGLGRLNSVPLPASLWLCAIAFASLVRFAKR